MIDRLVIIKLELLQPSEDSSRIFAVQDALSSSAILTMGDVIWVTDDPGFPLMGSHSVFWVREVDPCRQ